jgi:hypothetical protein
MHALSRLYRLDRQTQQDDTAGVIAQNHWLGAKKEYEEIEIYVTFIKG